jgi:hypothetical protein
VEGGGQDPVFRLGKQGPQDSPGYRAFVTLTAA